MFEDNPFKPANAHQAPPTRYRNVMIDIESLGTKPGSVVLTIGAVAFDFDQDELGPEFYCTILASSCTKAGLTIDTDTILWWCDQSDEARSSLTSKNAVTLETGLMQLREFIASVRAQSQSREFGIWANDPDFDISLLNAAFEAVNINPPWSFWESRSVRTTIAAAKNIRNADVKKLLPRQGTYHNALDDSKYQALYTKLAFDFLRGVAKAA